MKRLPYLVLIGIPAVAQPQYDLLIKGGHVIDAKNNLSAVRDVAISNRKVAEVAPNIAASKALKVIDATGLFVTPGLVDRHVLVYAGNGQRGAYSGDLSVYRDGFTFRSGVTTVADAGSSGWSNFPDFKDRVIDRSKTRVLAFLNIVGHGMGGGKIEQNIDDMDASASAHESQRYRGLVIGIKTAHVNGPESVAVDPAVEAGRIPNIPVTFAFAPFRPERPYQILLLNHPHPIHTATTVSLH